MMALAGRSRLSKPLKQVAVLVAGKLVLGATVLSLAVACDSAAFGQVEAHADVAIRRLATLWTQLAVVDTDHYKFPDPLCEIFARIPGDETQVNSVRVIAMHSSHAWEKPEPCGDSLPLAWTKDLPAEALHKATMAGFAVQSAFLNAGTAGGADEFFAIKLAKAEMLLSIAKLPADLKADRSDLKQIGETLAKVEEFHQRVLSDDAVQSLATYQVAVLKSAQWRDCLDKFELAIHRTLTGDDGRLIVEVMRQTRAAGGAKLNAARMKADTVIRDALAKRSELKSALLSALDDERKSLSQELKAAREHTLAAIQ